MSNIYQLESKEFEKRYGPAIAQFLCDELEKSERLNQKIVKEEQTTHKNKQYMYRAA